MYGSELEATEFREEALPCAPPAAPPHAVEWVRSKLGFEPDAVQSQVLASRARRGILNCTRLPTTEPYRRDALPRDSLYGQVAS